MAKSGEKLFERILEHVSSTRYRPERPKTLAQSMGLEGGEYPAFREAVKELMKAGRVVLGSGELVMLPQTTGRLVGQFRGHERGFGFVVPDSAADHGDLFIPPGATLDAMTGDSVVARITRRGKAGDDRRVEGEVVEILQRGQSRFVGGLQRDGTQWLVMPDGRTLHKPIMVGDVRSTRAKAGDQVVVEMTEFPAEGRPGRGVIVEILGSRGDPGIDTISIVRQYHLRDTFPEDALEQARGAIREYNAHDELAGRDDLRNEVIVTIDPDDARDFDDAISLRTMPGGGFELGVHIADVSHFVPTGGPLDREAGLRGNSVYLPRHVLPMLPEVLSNGVCSLQEGQPRLCKSAFIHYDRPGRRKGARFANTVIGSAKRLTYTEATAILEGGGPEVTPEVRDLLTRMEQLARIIQKRRLSDGMIVLDIPEVELVLDDEGNVTGVQKADTSFSHTIIEMFMVEANEVVSELFTRMRLPHLRRIHPEPPPDAQQKLSRFLRVLGMKAPEKPGRKDMIRLLESVKGKPQSFAVNLSVLRSMSQAEYSPRKVGHFALASETYAHFTSPIRRYPDLLIHRLLEEHLAGRLGSQKQRANVPGTDALIKVGKQCTYSEQRAEAAERELRLIKTLRFLEGHLGDAEDGVVTGVAQVGLFVQVQRYMVDGLIRFADLADDWWEIDSRGGCVVGQRSGRRIRVGDPVRVVIAAVDLGRRELILAMEGQPLRTKPSPQTEPARTVRSKAGQPAKEPSPLQRGPSRRGQPSPARKARGKGRRGRW